MYKQSPKSPAMKALVGNQSNLPEALQAAIKAAPAKMMGETPIKKKNEPSKEFLAKKEKVKKEKEENALRIKRERREKMAMNAEKGGDFERARRIRSQGEDAQDKDAQDRISSPARNYKKGYYGV